jgi:hypothetical protein
MSLQQLREPLKDEWGNYITEYTKIKTPCIQRTLFLDLPENLLINMRTYYCLNKYTYKDH